MNRLKLHLTHGKSIIINSYHFTKLVIRIIILQKLHMFMCECHWLVKLCLQKVANGNFIQSDLNALGIVQQLWTKVEPFEEFDGLSVIFLIFIDHCHAVSHMCLLLNVSNFNASFCFGLDILYPIHIGLFWPWPCSIKNCFEVNFSP